jgi:hypothetical protein
MERIWMAGACSSAAACTSSKPAASSCIACASSLGWPAKVGREVERGVIDVETLATSTP